MDDIDGFAARFQACALRKEEWTHHAHLIVGMWHIDRYGAEQALIHLRSGIRQLNESFGGQNTPTSGYHETITAAYVILLSQYLARRRNGKTLRELTTQLLAGPIAAKDVLLSFYSRERLMSTEARAAWIEPDLGSIDLGQILEMSRLSRP
jgi:hypothetical protein